MNEEYTVIDDFLSESLYKEVCEGVKSLHRVFNDPDNTKNGNEYGMLGTVDQLKNNEIKNMPLFLKKYLDYVLLDKTNVFFQNLLYINDLRVGIPWHVDSQIKDRVEESSKIKHTTVFQNTFPDTNIINVYYPFVPETMEDGHFHVKTSSGKEVEIKIAPNRMISILGTTQHKTSPITPSAEEYRISMITEQVTLPSMFDSLIGRRGFLYGGMFDDILIDEPTGHYTEEQQNSDTYLRKVADKMANCSVCRRD